MLRRCFVICGLFVLNVRVFGEVDRREFRLVMVNVLLSLCLCDVFIFDLMFVSFGYGFVF